MLDSVIWKLLLVVSSIVNLDAAASSADADGAGDCAHNATADGALELTCVKLDELDPLAGDA